MICRKLHYTGTSLKTIYENTVSALALKYLSSVFSIPIIGVIESGVKSGIRMNQNNKIAVLGTSATIRSNVYGKKIKAVKGLSKYIITIVANKRGKFI